jgi:hypothetical protein
MPKNTIKFGKVVSAIYWEQSLSKVKVICEDEEYVADHIIVTCSRGYLKLHHNKLNTSSKANIDVYHCDSSKEFDVWFHASLTPPLPLVQNVFSK